MGPPRPAKVQCFMHTMSDLPELYAQGGTGVLGSPLQCDLAASGTQQLVMQVASSTWARLAAQHCRTIICSFCCGWRLGHLRIRYSSTWSGAWCGLKCSGVQKRCKVPQSHGWD